MILNNTASFKRYKCGIARQFLDMESGEHYDERWMGCNWNKTWTKTDMLDECVWIQCINPPQVDTCTVTFFNVCKKLLIDDCL